MTVSCDRSTCMSSWGWWPHRSLDLVYCTYNNPLKWTSSRSCLLITSGSTRYKEIAIYPFQFHQLFSRRVENLLDISYHASPYLLTRFSPFSSLARIFPRRLIEVFHRSFCIVLLAVFLGYRSVGRVDYCTWALRRPSAAFATCPLQRDCYGLTCSMSWIHFTHPLLYPWWTFRVSVELSLNLL